MRIALDAGHGFVDGRPTGAVGHGLNEDATALTIVNKLRWYLTKAGCEVVLTRPGISLVPLAERGRTARAKHCDAFISVHINAASDPNANGAEVLIAEADHHSAPFAEKLLDAMVRCGLKRRGVKWDSQSQHSRLKVLRDTYSAMPAVLIEAGFITNPSDAAKLANAKWLDMLAKGLADTVTASMEKYACRFSHIAKTKSQNP